MRAPLSSPVRFADALGAAKLRHTGRPAQRRKTLLSGKRSSRPVLLSGGRTSRRGRARIRATAAYGARLRALCGRPARRTECPLGPGALPHISFLATKRSKPLTRPVRQMSAAPRQKEHSFGQGRPKRIVGRAALVMAELRICLDAAARQRVLRSSPSLPLVVEDVAQVSDRGPWLSNPPTPMRRRPRR
jgi:hypothetical protein